MQYRLERDDRGPLVIEDGDLIGEISTRKRGKMRWTELQLYRVNPSHDTIARWVVYSVGQTQIPDEKVFRTATICSTVEDVATALSRNGSLSGPGFDLMDIAAEDDEEIDAYLDKVMETEERL